MNNKTLQDRLMYYKKNIVKSINDVNETNMSIGTTHQNLLKLQTNLDEYIDFINKIDTDITNIDAIDKLHTQLDLLNKNIQKILKNNAVKVDNNSYLKKSHIKTNDQYQKILSAFKIILYDYRTQLDKVHSKQTNAEVYTQINESLVFNILKSQDLLEEIINFITLLDENLKLNLSEYDKSDMVIVPTNKKIDTYIKIIDVDKDNALYIISGNIKNVIEISEMLLNSISIDGNFDKLMAYTNDIKIMTFDEIVKHSPIQHGGSNTTDNFVNLSLLIEKINLKLEELYSKLVKLKIHKIQHNNFTKFLMLATKKNNSADKIIQYEYINQQFLKFYLKIIESILAEVHIVSNKPHIKYFYRYHYVTLIMMQKFCKFAIDNMNINDVIDIKQSKGTISQSFLIFNHFKDILDSYNETFLNNKKINVYARIDNVGTLFRPDTNDQSILLTTCADHATKIKFDTVFDPINFNLNINVQKYLNLETQLVQKKDCMLITCGKNGSSTLFGDKHSLGLVQSTLHSIKNLKEIQFRIRELYGHGIPYSYYWNNNVVKDFFTYELLIYKNKVDYEIKPLKNNDVVEFKKFNMKQINNFHILMSQINKNNQKEKVISTMIYEFQLLIDNDLVKLTFIELPGTITTPDINPRDEFERALLHAMQFDPLALALLVPTQVAETFNRLENEQKLKIIGPIDKVTLNNENISIVEGTQTQLSRLLKFDSNNTHIELINDNDKYNDTLGVKHGQKQVMKLNTRFVDFDEKMKVKHPQHLTSDKNNVQYQGVVALFIINRFILTKNIGAFELLYKAISDTYFNGRDITASSLFANIYSNETIAGLIKILAKDVANHSDDYIKGNLIRPQENMDFEKHKRRLRNINFGLYTENVERLPNHTPYENIYRSNDRLKELQTHIYFPNRLYRYDKPTLQTIFDEFIGNDPTKLQNFKLLYLFDNNNDCSEQLQVLNTTLAFINTLN